MFYLGTIDVAAKTFIVTSKPEKNVHPRISVRLVRD
jgi:hypothetical protein